MKKAMTRHSIHFNNDRMVVKREKTQVEFTTKDGKVIRVDAFKTSIPKMIKKSKTSSRKTSESNKK